MGKLYIFGIGGTGSRVLKSLTMLLASGVEINADEIVPIIIDPDHAAADLTRTVKLLQDYAKIRSNIDFNSETENKFFGTKINLNIVPQVVMPLQNTQNKKFKDYIGYDTLPMGGANQALASMLFSQKNMDADMEVGFKGNPNIGSVVLNQFQDSVVFKNIVSSFKQGDRIFVISSIFGGTGASGFPLLVKNLRAVSNTTSGSGNVKDAPIGAVTVLPYFDLKPSVDSEIDASTFVAKTRAALTYYDKNLNETNYLYYVADNITKQYENIDGGMGQKNDAHFIELVSALSIIDFMKKSDDDLIVKNGIPTNQYFMEYGIKANVPQILFKDLSDQTNSLIKKPLTQFVLFGKFLKDELGNSLKQPWAIDLGIDDNFKQSNFYSKLKEFFLKPDDSFFAWLTEMARNERSFCPFELDISRDKLFHLVKGLEPAKVLSFDSNYNLYNSYLNDEKQTKSATKEHSFIELFYKATKKATEKKLRM